MAIIESTGNYLSLAKTYLAEIYEKEPCKVSEEELNTEANLLLQAARASLPVLSFPEVRKTGALPPMKVSDSSRDPVALRITAYIKENALLFVQMYPKGCELSSLPILIGDTFWHCLKSNISCITSILRGESFSELKEAALNTRYKQAFEHIETSHIARACAELYKIYTEQTNKQVGFCLLWLIKLVTKGQFEIPPRHEFSEATVKKVISTLIENKSPLPFKFVEILFHPYGARGQFFYEDLLEEKQYAAFLKLSEECITKTPNDIWPAKSYVAALWTMRNNSL